MSLRDTLLVKAAKSPPESDEVTVKLPPELQEVIAHQPPNIDRKAGAALITRHLFPVSHRSLEAWPLPTRHVNGRAVIPTATLLEIAYQKLSSAPVIMGGKKAA